MRNAIFSGEEPRARVVSRDVPHNVEQSADAPRWPLASKTRGQRPVVHPAARRAAFYRAALVELRPPHYCTKDDTTSSDCCHVQSGAGEKGSGKNATCGDRMPRSDDPLRAQERDKSRAWIKSGAPNN